MGRRRVRLQRGVTENGTVFTDAERRYLSDFRLGRIATVGRDGTPHVAPVGWSYDPEHEVIEVGGRDFARSKKYHDVKRSGRAAIVIDDLPAIPGREVAGVVDGVGPGVDDGWVGRRVVAHLGAASAGYAELAVAPAQALHEVAESVGFDVAVAMIGTGRTALGILDVAALTGDDVVLVTAAAGGLGTLLVQAARNAAAAVVGVAGGPEKVEGIRALGADVAVDYREPGWPDRARAELGDREVSVVLDGVGGEARRAAMDLLGIGGRHVLFGWSSGKPTEVTTGDLMSRGLTVPAIGPRLLPRLRELETRALDEAAAGGPVPAGPAPPA